MKKIIVHPGQAHMDDLLCAAVAKYFHPDIPGEKYVPIYRREPTPFELADPEVLVMDVGRLHEPINNNFDHHQQLSKPCAFHLYMQALGLHEDASLIWKWYNFINDVDVLGPYKTASKYGMTEEAFFASSNPLMGWLTKRMQKEVDSEGKLIDALVAEIQDFGFYLMEGLNKIKERLERLKEEVIWLPFGSKTCLLAAWSEIEDEPTLAMNLFNEQNNNDFAISICPGERGPGWVLYRFNDHPSIDFSLLQFDPEIEFAHKGGFLASTKTRCSESELRRLIEKAVI